MQTTDNLERGGTSKLVGIAGALGEFGEGFTNEARFIFGMLYYVPHDVELCKVVHQSRKSSRAFRAGVLSTYGACLAAVPVYFGVR